MPLDPPAPGSPLAPSGGQWAIAHGRQRAVLTEVGATLREYTLDGEPVIDGFGPAEWSRGGRGQILAPWPNRLGDGRYRFDGEDHQAALDEPERANAIHGLVRWLPWRCLAHAQNVVSLACDLHPTPGYPFCLSLRVQARLGRDGLAVTTSAVNAGTGPLPFGLGFHPYLRAGAGRIDDLFLQVPATGRLVVDQRAADGRSPDGRGDPYDFTTARPIGTVELDTAYCDLVRGEDGTAVASIEDPVGGRRVELWADGSFRYLMVYTGDTLDEPGRRRRSVAVEPMTCPPDALRSGRDLAVLGAGERLEARWGIRVR